MKKLLNCNRGLEAYKVEQVDPWKSDFDGPCSNLVSSCGSYRPRATAYYFSGFLLADNMPTRDQGTAKAHKWNSENVT
jgi:hypothetical protein